MTDMFGKGLFIWKIKNASGGDVNLIADKAAQLGLNFIAVKVNRGYWSYNWRQLPDGTWIDDYIPALRDALAAKSVDLYGWGGAWLLNGEREAKKALERMEKHDLKGYFIDAEGQAKNSPNRFVEARKYATVMQDVDAPVLLCSYRWPSLHPELPWKELLECCTHHAPQVYWIHGANPKVQLERSIKELLEKKDLPFVPAGPAFDEHGWCPNDAELDEFNQATIDQGCEGVIWWEYDEAEDNDFFPVIQAHQWPIEPPTEPPPTDTKLEQRVAALEDSDKQQNSAIETMIDFDVEIDERVTLLENVPAPTLDTIRVRAIDKIALAVLVGHDKACPGMNPPGKPILEPPNTGRVVIQEGDTILVNSRAVYSCKDNAITPEILATGNIPFYIVADGQPGAGQFCRKDKTTKK